ncbi:MAG: hypothetical protein ACFCBW_08955 [Candidatus Competibacterales bacterium]
MADEPADLNAKILRNIQSTLAALDHKVDALDHKVDALDHKVTQGFAAMERDIAAISGEVTYKLRLQEAHLARVNDRLDDLERRVATVENRQGD